MATVASRDSAVFASGGAKLRARVRRQTLDEFPCYHGWHDEDYMCSGGCRDRIDTGEWKCPVLAVYREYLALWRCARLLRVFERRWAETVRNRFAWLARARLRDPRENRRNAETLVRFVDLTDAIRDALRMAGLGE